MGLSKYFSKISVFWMVTYRLRQIYTFNHFRFWSPFFSYSRFSKKNFESHLVKLDDSYQQTFGLVQSQIYNCKVEFCAREIESVDLPRSVDRFLGNSSNFWNIFHLLNSCRFVSCLKILKSRNRSRTVQLIPLKFVNEGWVGLRTQILGLWISR